MTDMTTETSVPEKSKAGRVLTALAWFAIIITGFGFLLHSCVPVTPKVTPPTVIVAKPKPEPVAPPCICDKPAPKKSVKKVTRKKPAQKSAPTPPAPQEERIPQNWRERNTGMLSPWEAH